MSFRALLSRSARGARAPSRPMGARDCAAARSTAEGAESARKLASAFSARKLAKQAAGAAGVGLALYAGNVVFLSDTGVIYVHQNMVTGELRVYNTPGLHNLFRLPTTNVTQYNQVISLHSTTEYKTSSIAYGDMDSHWRNPMDRRRPTSVRFADAYTALVPTMFRFKLPSDSELMIKLHREFQNQHNLEDQLLDRTVENVTALTGALYTADEFFEGGLNEFTASLSDQIRHGCYETKKMNLEVGGKTIQKAVPLRDECGMPRRAGPSPLAVYGIDTTQVVVGDPLPEASLERLLEEKKKLKKDDDMTRMMTAMKKANQESKSSEMREELEGLRVRIPPRAGLDDVVGLEAAKRLVHEAVVYPARNPDLFTGLREPPRGVLLHGPPGCGKTLLAKAVAAEVLKDGGSFYNVPAGALMAKYYGESQRRIEALSELVAENLPAVVFFDEVDSLLGRRDDGQVAEHHRATTNAVLTWMDGFDAARGQQVFFMAATNLRSHIDDAALRRFHASVLVPLPEHQQRRDLIEQLLAKAASHNQPTTIDKAGVEEAAARTAGLSFDAISKAVHHAFLAPIRELPVHEVPAATPATLRPVALADLQAAVQEAQREKRITVPMEQTGHHEL